MYRAGLAARQRGFTLLEAIVAMVILASASMALYSLFNTNLITLGRVQEVSKEVPRVRQASHFLAAMNLTRESAGEFDLDGARVVWSARLLEPYRQGQSGRGFLGYFQLGLYGVEFSIVEGEKSSGTYSMRLVGYEKVREPG